MYVTEEKDEKEKCILSVKELVVFDERCKSTSSGIVQSPMKFDDQTDVVANVSTPEKIKKCDVKFEPAVNLKKCKDSADRKEVLKDMMFLIRNASQV